MSATEALPRAEPQTAGGRVDHLPALDGIRGLGIPIVLLYHHNVTWLTGGVLAVSMFFTLSGFLITRLMIAEWERSGTVSLRRFYERRARRLFPSSFVVLLGVVVIWTAFPGSGRRLGFWEWFSGLTYWENTYLLVTGKDYGGLFGLANPVQHLWSLSLEEQVYLVFPLVVLALLAGRRTAAASWRLFAVLAALAGTGFLLGAWYESHGPLWANLPGIDAKCEGVACAYYATEVRAGEFFIGAAFAVLWMVWKGTPGLVRWLRRPRVQVASYALLALEVWLWWQVGYRNSWTEFFFPWGVLVNGLVVCALMAVASAHTGVSGPLSWKPLRYVGQITYTIYLVHWPVFLLFDSWRLDPSLPKVSLPVLGWETVDGFWLFWPKLALTMGIVIALYHLLEDPVRRRQRWIGWRLAPWLAAIAVVGTLVAAFGIDRRASANDALSALDSDALALQQAAIAGLADLAPDAPTSSAVDPELPARLLLVGDSQSWVLASGLEAWEAEHGVDLVPSPGVGCGIGENTPVRYLGIEQPERPGCTEWRTALPAIVDKLQPNLVVVVGGAADLSDRQIPGVDGWASIGEAAYDEWLVAQMEAFVDVVAAGGAPVLWLTHPHIEPQYQAGETGTPPFAEAEPQRMDRYNELIERLAAADPRVLTADFASAVRAHPGGEFETDMRPDGAHIDLRHAPALVAWLDAAFRDAHAS